MPSQISQLRNQQQPQINEAYIDQLKQLMKSGNAPQYLAQAALSNPQIRQILELYKNSSNPQALFESLARQQGVDPNWLINKLMG